MAECVLDANVLQKEGRIGPVATFDAGFDAVPGFVRVPFVERTRG
jgi:hypothetical protein